MSPFSPLFPQVFHLLAAQQDLAEGTWYKYDKQFVGNVNRLSITEKIEQFSQQQEQNGPWVELGSARSTYSYDRHGRLYLAGVLKIDQPGGPALPQGSFEEVYTYDIFGRRSLKQHRRTDLIEPPIDANLLYSYDGLSENVLGRMGHRWMMDTYTFGLFGPAIRTDCHGTGGDTSDDKDYYYLYDAMGGTVGMMVPDSSPSATWQAVFEVFDAFGNRIAPKPVGVTAAAEYCWRGAEGSETDIGRADPENYPDFNQPSDEGTGLVYMQTRYYDPETGRFIQADMLPIASNTSQGLNRYTYCENDPLNLSDPKGTAVPLALLALGIGVAVVGFVVGFVVGLLWALGVVAPLGLATIGERLLFGACALFMDLVLLAVAVGAGSRKGDESNYRHATGP